MAGSQATSSSGLMTPQAAKLYLRCRKQYFRKRLTSLNVCTSPADIALALSSLLEESPKQAKMLRAANWKITDLMREINYGN